ncbi:MAG TPA: hypothetical protein VF629_04025 [Hymenobacter sp.]|jgi:hypothetical protein|uniref:hypothetical protein n=1 Tax=Hymenobacter sp. TaxID=1898978 RepID=UPI002ED89E4A
MLLGVYWYYDFPEGLYHFDYFTFQPGFGGHADGPAELTATVRAPDPAALLAAVQAVAARYPDGYLFAYAHGELLRLTLGDWSVTDYIFHVAGELEAVLRQHQATRTDQDLPAEATLLHLAQPQDPTPLYSYGDGLLQAVSANSRKHRAEVAMLRLDCHLPRAQKAAFIIALDGLRGQAGLDVLYYFDHELPDQVNLMVFLTNGRQGVGGQPLRYTHATALTTAVRTCLAAHGGQPGHRGRHPTHYPRRGPHVVRMADEDFVL